MNSFVDRLNRTDLQALMDIGRPAYYRAGECVMREGEPGDYVVLVRSGQVKISSGAGGGPGRLLGVRGAGDLLGEMACLDERPRSATVIAHGPVRGVMITGTRFREFLRRNPTVGLGVACQVIGRLRAAERRHGELASHEIAPRLVRILRELVTAFQTNGITHDVEIPLSQHEIAQLINAADVSTQRALRALRHRRLVATGYGKVIVCCVSCLDRAAAVLAAGRKEELKNVIGCGGSAPSHSPVEVE
ncbi:MAG TPA: cyclic nucleotide-binding domain-containing protein [Actinophytocola sp.]|uniref:Crp/Fnr family transcriptional regulator n=1 Tax=Actinophytocola sp. TaxID=1872138 RepID=UPI002E0133C8|nr:cyclic nucleotide-binding domain-containing protein [Actinophytocola sp.]